MLLFIFSKTGDDERVADGAYSPSTKGCLAVIEIELLMVGLFLCDCGGGGCFFGGWCAWACACTCAC